MASIRIIRSPLRVQSTTSAGDQDPYSAGTLECERQEVGEGQYTIPSGAYAIVVTNSGLNSITVNGSTVFPGGMKSIRAFVNEAEKRMDFCPEVTIDVPADGQAWYSVQRPSNP